MTDLRSAALRQHGELPWPHASDDIWRRTDVSLLDPQNGFTIADGPGLLQSVKLTDRELAHYTNPLADEHLLVRADGAWVQQKVPAGIIVEELAKASGERAERIKPLLESQDLTPAERKLTSLNAAFHGDAFIIEIPAGFTSQTPIRLVRLLSAKAQSALFPLTVIVVGKGAQVQIIHEDVSLAPEQERLAPHLINGRIELQLEPGAIAHYSRIQRWGLGAREFLLQRASLQQDAQLTMANINLGAGLSKTHVIAKLLGRGSSSKVFGFVFGHGQQHIDFHSLQDHQAPQTTSDLLYKAALKDSSRLIYTGLIRIAKAAKQTNAYQANHNLLLSQRSTAETVPMLEILADDVACKHGATVGPVDEEQLFYLRSRGVPHAWAERLLVMGFVEPIIEHVPFEPLRQRLRDELDSGLHGTNGHGAGSEPRQGQTLIWG